MKITKVEPIFVDRFLFVRIETDAEISGIGESGAWAHLEASAGAVRRFSDYLVGKDPRQIEHHWNVMHRFQHFAGAAISGAISAIDVALWDIKGRSLGVPVYELLGGAMRRSARLYSHCKGRTADKLVERAQYMKKLGFTALGCMNPFLEQDFSVPWFQTHASRMNDAIENLRRVREAVGFDIDMCVEIHSRMTPAEAGTFARAIEPLFPMFIEDPIRPYNPDAMAWVADHSPVPIATGERFVSIQQFQTLLNRRGVEFLRPCISVCGGITGGKKIAALAEAADAQIVFHNPLSPVNLAACLHLDASIPNFSIQEYPYENLEIEGSEGLRGGKVVTGLAEPIGGFIRIPDGPGLGVELLPEAQTRFPRRAMPLAMRPHLDGSVVDD
jgi:galactonate dehydratase